MEKWRLLGQQAGWVSSAAVLMLTVGASDPGAYVLRHAGLTLIGAAVGVLVTTVLFPTLQLTQAVEQIARTRAMLAGHLQCAEVRAPSAPSDHRSQCPCPLWHGDRGGDHLHTREHEPPHHLEESSAIRSPTRPLRSWLTTSKRSRPSRAMSPTQSSAMTHVP
jgi:hypothetical protein